MNIPATFRSESCFSYVDIKPVKHGTYEGLFAHNQRLLDKYGTNPDIDPNRTYLCYSLIKPKAGYRELFDNLMEKYHIKFRKDSNCLLLIYISISPALAEALGPERMKSYFRDSCTFVLSYFPEECIFSFDVHMDEERPHAHVVLCPVSEDKHLNTTKFLKSPYNGRNDYYFFKTKFFDYMQNLYPELRRRRFDVNIGRKMVSVQTLKDSQNLVDIENDFREAMQLLTPENAIEKLPGVLAVGEEILRVAENARSAVFSVNDHIKGLEKQSEDLEKENDYLKSHIEDMEYVTNHHIDELSVVLPEMASRFHDRYKWYYVDPSESSQIEKAPERQPVLPTH